MITVTVTGPNCPQEIHAANCHDLKNVRKFRHPAEDFWTLKINSMHDLALEIWGDVATDQFESDTPEWHAECDSNMSEYRVMPCVPKMPATS